MPVDRVGLLDAPSSAALAEPAAPAAEPFGDHGVSPALEARCSCGRSRHATDPTRCAGGHPWRGLPGPALIVGATSAHFWAAAEALVAERRRAYLHQCGYREADAPRDLADISTGLAQAVLMRDSAFARIADSGGPTTIQGRTRAAYPVWKDTGDSVLRHSKAIREYPPAHAGPPSIVATLAALHDSHTASAAPVTTPDPMAGNGLDVSAPDAMADAPAETTPAAPVTDPDPEDTA